MAKISRLAALAKGEPLDRVPMVLSLTNYAPKLLEISAREFFLNPDVAFNASIWTKQLFPDDSGIGYSVPEGICWDFGGEVKFGAGVKDWPIIVRHPVRSLEDVARLEVPDPHTAPAATREFEFAKIRRAHGIPGGSLTFTSPFRQTVQLVDPNLLLRWVRKEPEAVDELSRKTLEYSLRVARMYAEEFGTNGWSILVTYPMESHNVLSPDNFTRFSAPRALELHEGLREIGYRVFTEHPCGNHEHNYWFWREKLELPERTVVSVGTELPLEYVSDLIGPHLALGGGVDTQTLVVGSPAEVYDEARAVLEKLKYREGGFVLMASCVITVQVPPANIAAMVKAVEDFGRY